MIIALSVNRPRGRCGVGSKLINKAIRHKLRQRRAKNWRKLQLQQGSDDNCLPLENHILRGDQEQGMRGRQSVNSSPTWPLLACSVLSAQCTVLSP